MNNGYSETPTKGNVMLESTSPLSDFDAVYTAALNDIISFFRFEKRHSNAVKFDDDYYARAATVMKRRIDYEMKYLREPSFD